MAVNDEKGLLVTVTGNGGLLQNHTAVRNLLKFVDEAEGEIGVTQGSSRHKSDLLRRFVSQSQNFKPDVSDWIFR